MASKVGMVAVEVVGEQSANSPQVSQVALLVLRSQVLSYEGGGSISVSGGAYIGRYHIASGSISISGGNKVTIGLPTSGGVTTSGTATAKLGNNFNSSGDVSLSGSHTLTANYNYTGSGTITMGGEAYYVGTGHEWFIADTDPTGDVKLGGEATIQLAWNVIGQGGIVVSGDSASAASREYTANSAIPIVLSGVATASWQASYEGSGGITASGSGTSLWSKQSTGSGTISISGDASSAVVRNASGSGTISIGGSANITMTRNYTARVGAGIVIGGGVNQSSQFTFESEGTISITGQAKVTGAASFVGSGTIGSFGSGAQSITVDLNSQLDFGSFSLFGEAIVTRPGIAASGSGTVTIGGEATYSHTINYSGGGSISVSGGYEKLQTNYRYAVDQIGRILVFGKADVSRTHYDYEGEGRIRITGRAGTTYCPLEVCSESIYYRYLEGNPGCKITYVDPIDPSKKVKKSVGCVTWKYVNPHDTNRAPRTGAMVPAATVCLSSLFPKKPAQICPQKEPK